MRKQKKITRVLKNYIKRTWKNKMVAIILLIIGRLSVLPENDATAFVFVLLIAIPLFFANKDLSKDQ